MNRQTLQRRLCQVSVVSVLGAGLLSFAPALSAGPQQSPPAQPAKADGPTFSKDIAPVLQKKCQVCHQPGSIAPMSLLTYADTRPWVRSIKDRVVSRKMPPWPIDKTVGIQEFTNDLSLSDHDVDMIAQWVDAGA